MTNGKSANFLGEEFWRISLFFMDLSFFEYKKENLVLAHQFSFKEKKEYSSPLVQASLLYIYSNSILSVSQMQLRSPIIFDFKFHHEFLLQLSNLRISSNRTIFKRFS
ncbi:hypothetical protein [Xylocopilactobacillus apicola]|uniref:hypothetical protein n=1 Tax=Xylocopilactobacillus apicola TaxID=2932184 RepID=UPI002952BA2F|nr:hypothetical protein [Xylocopilactobacillus apicola]